MQLFEIYELLLESDPSTGIIVEEQDGSQHCQTLVGTLSVFTYTKIEYRVISSMYVKDNNLHIVLEEK